MKRNDEVRVAFTGKVVAKPTGDAVKIRVDGMPGWHAVVPISSVHVYGEPDGQCYWFKDGERCILSYHHDGLHVT